MIGDIVRVTGANGRLVSKEGRCACGQIVNLMYFTCTCRRCGRDYNSAGQELAPRWQWGEETGESLAEILSVDGGYELGDD